MALVRVPEDRRDRRKVALLTTARSDYYQARSILRALRDSESLHPHLLVSGSHLSGRFGRSLSDIEADGIAAIECLPMLLEDDSRLGTAISAGLGVQMIGSALDRIKPDVLLLMGDRYEVLASALAAACVGIPIAHVHGGERTDGAMDDSFRHAITKLADVHFVSTEVYRERILQMGELPDRVITVGAPLVDQLLGSNVLPADELAGRLGIDLHPPVALVAYHPPTREPGDPGEIIRILLTTAAQLCQTVVVTAPNQDPGSGAIRSVASEYATRHPRVRYVTNLGADFPSMLKYADVMVGNSSAGIHEAAAFGLPVVNVGNRQASRLRPGNVIDCTPEEAAISAAMRKALSPEFRAQASVRGASAFGDGRAGERIVRDLEGLAPFAGF